MSHAFLSHKSANIMRIFGINEKFNSLTVFNHRIFKSLNTQVDKDNKLILEERKNCSRNKLLLPAYTPLQFKFSHQMIFGSV